MKLLLTSFVAVLLLSSSFAYSAALTAADVCANVKAHQNEENKRMVEEGLPKYTHGPTTRVNVLFLPLGSNSLIDVYYNCKKGRLEGKLSNLNMFTGKEETKSLGTISVVVKNDVLDKETAEQLNIDDIFDDLSEQGQLQNNRMLVAEINFKFSTYPKADIKLYVERSYLDPSRLNLRQYYYGRLAIADRDSEGNQVGDEQNDFEILGNGKNLIKSHKGFVYIHELVGNSSQNQLLEAQYPYLDVLTVLGAKVLN